MVIQRRSRASICSVAIVQRKWVLKGRRATRADILTLPSLDLSSTLELAKCCSFSFPVFFLLNFLARGRSFIMLNQLSNAVALYLAPVLSLTAVLLALFSYLSPAVMLQTRVALLVVKPSLLLLPNPSKDQTDGPSVFLGALGTPAD